MKRIFILITLIGTAGAQSIPTTPNLHLPLIPDGYQNWGVPYRQTMNLLDSWSVTVAPLASPIFTGTITFPTSLNGCLQAANGVVSASGVNCNTATFTYPAAGIVVSNGSNWGASLVAPSSPIVGTTDSQTLTNKVVNGVSPTTFGYLDPTSSVQNQLDSKAPLASPALTGVPTAPTATAGTNTTQVATTAFVQTAVAGGGGGGGTPGGTSGQVQYNNAGAFGGLTGIDTTAGAVTAIHVSGGGGNALVASAGIIDGYFPVFVSTATAVTVAPSVTGGQCDDGTTARRCSGASYYNNVTGGTAAATFTLPPVVAGSWYCFENYSGVTGAMTLQTSGAGQYITLQGVDSASGGYASMGGALGDAVCLQGADTSHWFAKVSSGTLTLH